VIARNAAAVRLQRLSTERAHELRGTGSVRLVKVADDDEPRDARAC
jgi:hypothetical protein